MKIICNKSELLNGVSIVKNAVPSKTTMSILQCILIDADADQIKLVANDMELGIETVIQGSIAEKGKIALDARMLFDIIRKLPDSDITITTDASLKANISCEKSQFNIIGKPADEFPVLAQLDHSDSITLSQYTLKEVIRQTIFSISDNDNSPLMTGELFDINEDNLRVASLDGHRISIRNVKLKNVYSPKKVVVPGKSLGEISKIIGDDTDKNVSIFFTPNHILFEFDNTVVLSRLIEGEYFNVDQMITKDYETKVTVSKKDLFDCIDRSTLLVKEGDKRPIIVDIREGSLELKINSTFGSMDEEIDISKEGKDIMIGFNPKFVMDVLKVIDSDEINMYMVNPKSPCFIRDDDDSYIYLVLPINFTTVS
ncbi:MAG: DNA polymerase III subunit beta [Lachnospiraceae bacterium]|jgi:DNA polymerase-3 subunit beta|nr:DNA polymerase III subunit beta [Lachnospiraceae bacterium]MCR4595192.1 DNA polymerase III subunit beta [Lachnospiraceae bacterium]